MMDKRLYPIEQNLFKSLIQPTIEKSYVWKGRLPKISHYQVFCAILYVLRTGIPWRGLPKCFGNCGIQSIQAFIEEMKGIYGGNTIARYDTGNIRNSIKSKRTIPVIPLKGVYLPNDSALTPEDFYDTKLYRKRHIIERLFGRLKENKIIAMRFDKLDSIIVKHF